MKKRQIAIIAGILVAVLGATGPVAAQDDWEYFVAPYLWGAGLDGSAGVLGRSVDVSASFSDIVENLDGGAMVSFNAQKGRWGWAADVVYTSVAQGTDRPSANVDLDQPILELVGTYAVNPQFAVLLGARYTKIDLDIAFQGPFGRRLNESQDWLDPVVGGRATVPLGFGELRLRGDVGGFGVGSEMTWQAAATLLVDLTERLSLGFGYRILDADYEDGAGAARFTYDVETSGLLLGLGFRF